MSTGPDICVHCKLPFGYHDHADDGSPICPEPLCKCGWPKVPCLRRVLSNGPPFPDQPCEPTVPLAKIIEVASKDWPAPSERP